MKTMYMLILMALVSQLANPPLILNTIQMRRFTAMLVSLLLFVPFAQGQAVSGIASIALSVDLSTEASARACGISVASLDAAMRIPLSNTRLSVMKGADGVLSTNVNVVQAPNGQCAATIAVSMSRLVSLQADPKSPRVFADVWSNSHVLIGFPSGFGKAVYDKVDDFTKQFIAAWLKDR